MQATYVSVFDDCITYRSKCEYNPETKVVSNIEPIDEEGSNENALTDEYVELPDGTILREEEGVTFDY